MQSEWDSVLLETYQLKKHLGEVRKQLAHSLYHQDAACRVIARLVLERDAARAELSQIKAHGGVNPGPQQETNGAEPAKESKFTAEIIQKLQSFSEELVKSRKAQVKPENWMSQVEALRETG